MQATDIDPELATTDLGPLAWVLDELRKSLDAASAALRRFVRDMGLARGSDMTSLDGGQLRIARQQLHQAVGALEMVGQGGPAHMLRAMEAAVQRFIERPELCNEAAAAKVERAGFALTDYLEALLLGKPATAVALFPQYRDTQELAGADRSHPADLWSLEWRWEELHAPAATEKLPYAAAVRSRLDTAVLRLVKSGDAGAARDLTNISLSLAAAQEARQPVTFWNVCAGFFEALALQLLPLDVYAKRAASRVLMQYATLAKGDLGVSDRLVQDLVFFCSQAVPPAGTDAPSLQAVRLAWRLDRFTPVDYQVVHYGRFDPVLLSQARKRIVAAKETWSGLSGGDAAKLKGLTDQFNKLSEALLRLHPGSAPLAQSLGAVVELVVRSGKPPPPELAMEVATAVLYLEAALQDLDPADAQLAERTKRLAERLDTVRTGGQQQALEQWMEELYRRVSDRQTMGSVVGELRGTLAELEKLLDQFFRAPADTAPLREAPAYLAQMRGVLSVLGLDQAAQAVLNMRDMVEEIMVTEIDPERIHTAGTFDKLGNNLGALGFLIDMLNYQPTLAKKLFVWDEARSELRPLMGRTAHAGDKSLTATADELSREITAAAGGSREQLSARLDTLATQASLAEQPGMAQTARQAAAAVSADDAQGAAAALSSLAASMKAAPAATPAPAAEAGIEEDDLQGIFLEEAREVVQNGLAAIQSLNVHPSELSELTTLRRAFHTLKGSSRMVGLTEFGEAAWALEQVLNTWLADQKPASHALLSLAGDAMRGFSHWVEDIAARSDGAWKAGMFRGPADALRTENRLVALELPQEEPTLVGGQRAVAAAEPESAPTAELKQPSAESEAEPTVEPQAEPAEAAAEVTLDTVPADIDIGFASAAVAAPLEPVAEPVPELPEFTFELPGAAEALPAAASAQELPPEIASIDLESLAAASDKAAEVAPELEGQFEIPSQGGVEVSDSPMEDLELDLSDFNVPQPQAEAPAAAAADAQAGAPVQAGEQMSDETETEEQIKVIGPLRIGIPLYNVYLNEADEWSRRLATEVGEWALELNQPILDSTVGLAHALAGSSATVGFNALSDIARAMESSLQRAQWLGSSTPVHAQAFVDAAEEIRRLLHQFAAGFLKEANPHVLQSLLALEEEGPVSQSSDWPPEITPGQSLSTEVEAAPQEPIPSEPPVSWEPAAPEPALDDAIWSMPAVVPETLPAPQGAEAHADEHDHDHEHDDIDVVDAIDPDLFAIFEEEAQDLMPQLGGALRQWSARPENSSARDEVLRALHTLKGSSRLAGALRLGELAHRMESQIESLGSERALSTRDVEPLLNRFDALQANFDGVRAAANALLAAPVAEPEAAASEAAGAVAAPPAEAPASHPVMVAAPLVVDRRAKQRSAGGVRVRSELLDRMVNRAGEVMITRTRLESEVRQLRASLTDLTGNLDRLRAQLRDIELQAESQMQSRLAQARDSAAGFDPLEFDRFTRVQELTRMMAESVNDVATVQRNIQRSVEATEDNLVEQARETRELQRDLLRTRMVEFESMADRLYRVVRLASKETGKQVKLDITGGTIEMDRGVLDRMTPAFEHLLRNCVAHGIELPTARSAAGKDPIGAIVVGLRHEGNDVSVEFRDDGAGMNLALIREKALAHGLIAPGQSVTDAEAAELVFRPGFSTASEVTELAGRGIGMDVVRAEVNALGGRIETSTRAGEGTTFKLVLPLTTAVTQVVMIRSGSLTVGLPANLVEIVRRVTAAEVKTAYETGSFELGGERMPFYWSGGLLQSSPRSLEVGKTMPVIVVRSAAQRIAMHVDEVLGNQEVVVKHLGPQLARLPGLAGMTVLASGAVVLIYNPVALATVYGEQARQLSAAQAEPTAQGGAAMAAAAAAAAVPQIPLVLVVDDSITVRRVTQRLLQREGYRVALAADGLQALERLAEEIPTVVLSDIEMPRMDGFDLARNIRGDQRLKHLPIIMITSRIAEKHREHAKELGVDHYLGKPYSEEELLSLVKHYSGALALA